MLKNNPLNKSILRITEFIKDNILIPLIFLFIFTFSYTQTYKTDTYKRDSLLLHHTGMQFYKYSVDGFYSNLKEEVERYNLEHDSTLIYKIVPHEIFYSPDSTFLYSFVTFSVGFDEEKWPDYFDHFSTINMVGFRSNVCEPWKVYPLNVIGLYDAPNLDTILHDIRKYYFNYIKNKSYYLDTNNNGKFESVKIGYTLEDTNFWHSFPELMKGRESVDSLYSFQFEFDNPHEETFKREGYQPYSNIMNDESINQLNKNNPFNKFSSDGERYLFDKIKDKELDLSDISNIRDSLYITLINRFSDTLVTIDDVIRIGIDYYTYKPEIDSVSYPDSLLRLYKCE